jgi:Rrf2 family protein
VRNLLRITDAAVLAIHALALLAHTNEPLSAGRIAAAMDASESHVSKVLQRLAKIGMISSVRGPRGGFWLETDPADINLLSVFEAVDGPVGMESCLLGGPVCGTPAGCAVRQLATDVRTMVVERLGGLSLMDLDMGTLSTEI